MYTETVALRTTLLLGCAVTAALAAWAGNPLPHLDSDFALGRLLRAMAVIKAGVVLAAICLLWWRFQRPVPIRLATACLVGVWLAAGASMLIWQLTAVPLAALTFHAGGLAFLVAAWRDDRTPV